MSKVLAVFCSDIHISTCPSARVASDWFSSMTRSLKELREVAEDNKAPIIVAGDIFDRWYAQPQLINFAIEHFPKCWAISGNHDLPNHNISRIKESAYWTLVEAGVVKDMSKVTCFSGVTIHPFPWGKELVPCDEGYIDHLSFQVAVVHKYIWEEGYGHVGADESKKVSSYKESLKGYDAAIFGDNHKGFIIKTSKQSILNCGTFFRRRSDEMSYKPQIGLLLEDGSISQHYLDVSKDMFIEQDKKTSKMFEESENGSSKFIGGLRDLGSGDLDFREAARRACENSVEEVRNMVLESIQ